MGGWVLLDPPHIPPVPSLMTFELRGSNGPPQDVRAGRNQGYILAKPT